MTTLLTAGRLVLAVDTPLTTLAETEHALLGLSRRVELPADVYVCTHMVREPEPHYAFSLTLSGGPVDLLRTQFGDWHTAVSFGKASASSGYSVGLSIATAQALAGSGGRCFRFPGQAGVVGSPTVAGILDSTPIARLEVLGGQPAALDDVVHTRDFVRPLWRGGDLVLPVLPAGPGAVAPFEVPNPTPCCGEHTPLP